MFLRRKMLREFFLVGTRKQRSFAFAGLALFVGHAIIKAVVKAKLNQWYASFYDMVGEAGDAHFHASNCNTDDVGSGVDDEWGSGGEGAGADEWLARKRVAVQEHIVLFMLIVLPGVLVHPLARWVGSVWCYSWRVALVRSYLAHWSVRDHPIEGAAQRVHEDTQRFADGLYNCFSILLDALLTLLVFVPVLLDLGGRVRPVGIEWHGWLMGVTVGGAVFGLSFSMIVGHRLVHLEVCNQRVEASVRTKLVMLEQLPASVCAASAYQSVENAGAMVAETDVDVQVEVEVDTISTTKVEKSPSTIMASLLREMWSSYRRLYSNFFLFNVWLSAFDQFFVVLPYLLVAQLLFSQDPSRRITLDVLVQTSNAFGKVFESLTVISENWAAVNAWRSVLRRLREFEDSVYGKRPFMASRIAVPSGGRRAMVEMVEIVGNTEL